MDGKYKGNSKEIELKKWSKEQIVENVGRKVGEGC